MERCQLPLTGVDWVDFIVTDRAVFDGDRQSGLTLVELAPGERADAVRAVAAANFRVSCGSY